MSKKNKPCRRTEIFKIENNKAIILGIKSLIELNEVATVVWEMANGLYTLEEIATRISQIYDMKDIDKILEDIYMLVKQMENQGILVGHWDPLYKHESIIKEVS